MREGSDALLITTGVTLQIALDAAGRLQADGIEVSVLHVPTVKPLDAHAVIDAASRVQAIVTVEENTIAGGLGSAVAEVVLEADFSSPRRFKRIGLPDVFPDKYGSQASLMDYYHISAQSVFSVVKNLLK